MSSVHRIAEGGFGVGTELYNSARPSYQDSALSHIRHVVRTQPPFHIVEIGAGTGIFTRAILAHEEWSTDIREIKAVEPSQGMRESFNALIQDKRVTIREGTFDSTDVENGWADVVIIAQAFHWCQDFDRASAEFARILKPNGIVAFIWNLEDRHAAKWVAQIRDRIEKHENGTPQFRLGLWRKAFDTESYTKLFVAPEEKYWSYHLPCTMDVAIDRAKSKSYIAILSDAERERVHADVQAIIKKGDDLVWLDESKGIFAYPYQTLVVISKMK